MRTYQIPVVWEMSGLVEVEAESLEEAIGIFWKNQDNYDLPKDQDYINDSFKIATYDYGILAKYNKEAV
jgi:hypothetical protein